MNALQRHRFIFSICSSIPIRGRCDYARGDPHSAFPSLLCCCIFVMSGWRREPSWLVCRPPFVLIHRFVGYKLPDGLKYVYLNPDVSEWKLSDYLISENGMMKNTFEQMFLLKNSTSALYGMYNDEKPMALVDASAYTWGHLKGSLVVCVHSKWYFRCRRVWQFIRILDYSQYPKTVRCSGPLSLSIKWESLWTTHVVRNSELCLYASGGWVALICLPFLFAYVDF